MYHCPSQSVSVSIKASPVWTMWSGDCARPDESNAIVPKAMPAAMTSQVRQYTPKPAATHSRLTAVESDTDVHPWTRMTGLEACFFPRADSNSPLRRAMLW